MAMMETTGEQWRWHLECNGNGMTRQYGKAMTMVQQYGSELNDELTTEFSDEERDDLVRLLVVEQKIKPSTIPTTQLLSNIKAPTTIPRTHLLPNHQKLCPFLTALKGFLLCKYTSNY